MSQRLGIYKYTSTALLLQQHGRVFACRSSDLGLIPGWDRLKYIGLRLLFFENLMHADTYAGINISECLINLVY